MREQHVACGGSDHRRPIGANALYLDCRAPPGSPARVNVEIDDLSRPLADNIPDILVDLLEIAAYVYCADQFTSRGTAKLNEMGSEWRRAFHFWIPVRKPAFWRQREIQDALTDSVSFLSEDEFTFDFEQAKDLPLLQGHLGIENPSVRVIQPDEVILFSGGLDSLAGTVEAVIGHGRKALLVSHCSSNMIASKQKALVAALRSRAPQSLFHIPVQVNKGAERAKDFEQRTRSFLFATLGFVVARMFGLNEVRLYENGIVSINLPVSENVVGSRASRTTHPRALEGFGRLFSQLVGQQFTVVNPYLWKTKADVVRGLVEYQSAHLIASTFSCANVRAATKLNKHCGVCSQCLDRRLGVIAAGTAEQEPAENYAIELFTGPRTPGRSTTMALAYIERARRLASMSEQTFISTYGQIFRALPFLPGSAEENVRRLWDLHQRHGREVLAATNSELAARSSLEELLDAAPNTLLAALRDVSVQPFMYEDPGAKEPPAVQQNAGAGRNREHAYLVFAIDRDRREVLFPGGIVFQGQIFELVDALFDIFEQDSNEGKVPEKYRYVSIGSLVRTFSLEEPTLRKRLTRARKDIAKAFRRIDVHVDENTVIENKPWKGYRLNPNLTAGRPAKLRVTPPMSQLAPTNVSTPILAH